ncbi:lipocalin family protein [Raineya orbicola]|uniref:lipocalin family protein n=1 Tax=Raineya orbicola TaxID=2016530 RepID=UPI000C6D7B48|nr:lipocalin family protein [Raineya orbicola]
MKRLSQILLLVVAIAMVACKGSPKDLIARKWVIDIESLKKESEKSGNKLSDAQMKLAEEMMKDMYFEFKKDGSFEASITGQKVKGMWSISDDGKKLKMQIEGEKESEMEILELSKSKFVGKGNNQMLTLKASN